MDGSAVLRVRLRGIHFGSYWMGPNDIVSLMAQDLAPVCDLMAIDPGIYDTAPSSWFEADARFNPANPIRWLVHEKVLQAVADHQARFVITNSGGLALRPETIEKLRSIGVCTVGISLSDPDVFPSHGKNYARPYDLFYSNSKYSLENQYPRGSAKLLPFAASPKLHRPLPEVKKVYDVVVVGHARRERLRLINQLQRHFSVGLFGNGWGRGSGCVQGEEHVRAINAGKMYLSFSRTAAGFMNIKVGFFEAMACRTLVITQHHDDISPFFTLGMEAVAYQNPSDLVDLIHYYLRHERIRQWIAHNGYRRLLKEHTWEVRWQSVLDGISACLGSGARRIHGRSGYGDSCASD